MKPDKEGAGIILENNKEINAASYGLYVTDYHLLAHSLRERHTDRLEKGKVDLALDPLTSDLVINGLKMLATKQDSHWQPVAEEMLADFELKSQPIVVNT